MRGLSLLLGLLCCLAICECVDEELRQYGESKKQSGTAHQAPKTKKKKHKSRTTKNEK